MLALIVFLAGLGDVLLLTLDMSLGTGLMTRTGMQPGSLLRGAEFLAVLAVAFGIIELDRNRAANVPKAP
jgi:hypothetical protein